MSTLKLGQAVFYTRGDTTFEVRVKRLHRDGTATVEAMFSIKGNERMHGYLGYRYRVPVEALGT